jgi:type I restriction enzyme M protein
MLDTDTKRRIDTARDILVGKVPDPKSQVEQITIALIYKFMDDMDAESEELGGKRKFFAGEFARYGWAKLMHAGLGGFEILNLYAEAITKMPENPGIPLLFRDIFKNAYLPYRDPETLKMFLKVIDEFSYDHSERLGDAFEYLLSVLGSQGDAGQFRTPRHIIDFMVEIIAPKKTETVLDPACGTAGFLISSYKHILKANTDKKGNSTLTPDDKGRLAQNFKGYDISPDMVRLSLVNLYLHGFADPHIYEYDTLASQDRWNDYADVILANPPFMSPKGGIMPHKRFSVQSKRSEVLFVDYMAEHLTPQGRAGIIVPEGIIFQSQTAYKQLRKMLIEEYLVAVVSLPAGVFQPYSGVKTSILILDKSLAKKSNTIAFFKVENDGFGLGAQRREINKNDMPQALAEITEYLCRLRAGESGEVLHSMLGLIVEKEKIAANGDYNLSGERYRDSVVRSSNYPMVPIGDICELFNGRAFKPEDWEGTESGGIPIIRIQNLNNANSTFNYFTGEVIERNTINNGELLFSWSGSRGTSFGAHIWNGGRAVLNQHIFKVGFDESRATKMYLLHALNKAVTEVEENLHGGVGLVHITKGNLEKIQIPLPPLDVQNEIVAEIESYQKVINGARAVLDNYRPHIPIHPDWPMMAIGTISTIVRGSSPRPQGDPKLFGGPVPRLMVADITRDGMYSTPQIDSLTEEGAKKSRPMRKGDVIITVSGNPGLPTILAIDACIHDGFVGLRELNKDVLPEYLYFALLALHASHGSQSVGAVFKNLTTDQIREFKIALPPLTTQQTIVAEIEAEQALVAANRELIARFEKKIQSTLARVWGEDKPAPVEA